MDLARFLRAAPLSCAADAVRVLSDVDRRLGDDDGLKWVNRVLLARAREVAIDKERGGWRSPPWLERLDVDAARLYCDAIAAYVEDPRAAPRAWRPLLAARRRGASPARCALAGLAAHLQRDLPLALVKASEALARTPSDESPEHADYARLTDVVVDVETAALARLARGPVARAAATIADEGLPRAALVRARRTAWRAGLALQKAGASTRRGRAMIVALDEVSAVAARALLGRAAAPFG